MSNANKAIPIVDVELPWGKAQLCYDTEAFCIIEKLTGKNSLDAETWRNPDLTTVTALLWAGLVDKQGMSLQDMRKKLGLAQIRELNQQISDAFLAASPAQDEKKSQEQAA